MFACKVIYQRVLRLPLLASAFLSINLVFTLSIPFDRVEGGHFDIAIIVLSFRKTKQLYYDKYFNNF